MADQKVKMSKKKDGPATVIPQHRGAGAESIQPTARIRGGTGNRIFRARQGVLQWLGLGMAGRPGDSWFRRRLAWWGLEPAGFGAILGGGLLFGAVHVGARPIEFATSFPGGVLLCYVTYRSGSIWPGWCVHVVQMMLVGTILFTERALRN